jgi:hypothetical protein
VLRELDQRRAGGLTVTLEWNTESGLVQIRCEDERTPHTAPLCYPVAPRDAWVAFLHPFARSPPSAIRSIPAARSDDGPDLSFSLATRDPSRRWYRRLSKLFYGPDLTDLGYASWWGF